MKKIFTIYTEAKDIQLVKDVGQVINYLAEGGRYEANLVTYKNQIEYLQVKKEAKNIRLKFIRNYGKILNIESGIIFYLIIHAKDINILNLYGNRISNLIYIYIYKKINKNGFSYIKMDTDILAYIQKYENRKYYKLKEKIYKTLSRYVDLYSIETKKSYEFILEKYKEYRYKIQYLPNCINDIYINQNIVLKQYEEKENIILVVGRIGAFQKNHELLLRAVESINLDGWKLVFIGNIEEDFKKYIDVYFKKNKHQLKNIVFKGEISDREELYEWYNRSKIFCLPSRYEGFAIACIEALYFGNWVIASKLTSTEEMLIGGLIGDLFENENESELKGCIEKAISTGFLSQNKQNLIYKHASNYRWSEKIKTIQKLLPI